MAGLDPAIPIKGLNDRMPLYSGAGDDTLAAERIVQQEEGT
jgi:hypothetical protein